MPKKRTARAKPATGKGASAPPTAPAKTRTRKAAIDRALKLAKLFDKNGRSLLRLVGNWQGEATKDQTVTNNEVVAALSKATHLAAQVLLDVDMLKETGFVPTAGPSSAEPLAAGERVVIKPKFFDPMVCGKVNNFEVVVSTGKFVRIKSAVDAKQPQMVVQRAWLEAVDEVEVDDAAPPETSEEEAEPGIEDDGGDPGGDDGDLDHRLPNDDSE